METGKVAKEDRTEKREVLLGHYLKEHLFHGGKRIKEEMVGKSR